MPPNEHIGSPNLKMFTFADLKATTRNFRADMMMGEGRFGKVFKGCVDERTLELSRVDRGVTIAIKRIDLSSPELIELKVN